MIYFVHGAEFGLGFILTVCIIVTLSNHVKWQ